MRDRRKAGAAWILLVALVSVGRAAEEPTSITVAGVEAARLALAEELGHLDGGEARDVEARKILERIDRYLVQQLDALDRAEEIENDAKAEASAADGVAALEPPFDLGTYDDAADRADRAALLVRRLERAVADAGQALTVAREGRADAEQRRRTAKEAANGGAADPIGAGIELRMRELESRLATAEVELRALEVRNARAALETNRATAKRLAAVREAMAAHLVLRPEDREERTAALEAERTAIRTRMREVRTGVEAATGRVQKAESERERSVEPGPELLERVAAAKAERSALQREGSVLAERLERLERLERWAEQRFQVLLGGVPRRDLEAWYATVRDELAGLDREESLKVAELTEVEREQERLRSEDGASAAARSRHLAALDRLVRLYHEELEDLSVSRGKGRRLIEDLGARVNTWTVRERLAWAAAMVGTVWSYEITSSDDQSITVGKIVLAILVFGLGYAVARLVATAIGRRALPRLGFDPGAAQAFEALGFYALLAVVFLVALRMVNIPLTAFAVVGGALAIGVGFGSQNVVNNFISGLILLAERPIKIGDLVELEGVYGNVERIGLRSTRVRTGGNVHVIVPNAMFLENRVINWTHNDPQVRVELPVGVAYGSPTQEVRRVLLEVLGEHERVLRHPAPKVLFTDFGDNALGFEAHFWMQMRVYMDRRELESELRFLIDDRFRQAGIVIAFPQRDVHLDSASPLRVQVVSVEQSKEGP